MTLLAQAEKLAGALRDQADKEGLSPDQMFLGREAQRALLLAERCEWKRDMNKHLRQAIYLLMGGASRGKG